MKNAFRNRELTEVRTNINLYLLDHNQLTTISPFSYFVLFSILVSVSIYLCRYVQHITLMLKVSFLESEANLCASLLAQG